LQDYLPAEARKTNALSLEITDDTTVAQNHRALQPAREPGQLVLIDGHFVPPDERAARSCAMGKPWPSGRPWPVDEVSAGYEATTTRADFLRILPLATDEDGTA
jgi:hypothetical protein